MFAEGKLWHGMCRFRTRTLEKTNAEPLIIAAGQNVKRLLAFGGRAPKKLEQVAALQPLAKPLLDLARRRWGVPKPRPGCEVSICTPDGTGEAPSRSLQRA